jgi:hypothetical protein
MYELEKKIGKVFTSKFVGTGPSSYENNLPGHGPTNVEKHCSRTYKRTGQNKKWMMSHFVDVFLKWQPTGNTTHNLNVTMWSTRMILVSLCCQIKWYTSASGLCR